MAKFKIAYQITKAMEGGYANNPNDRGGETYRGISRRFHPKWAGWQWLDTQAKPIQTNKIFPRLEAVVMAYYKTQFWDKLKLGFMPQIVANQVLDFAIHSGRKTASKNLQSVLNKLGAKLEIDGIIGRLTLSAIQAVNPNKLAESILNQRAAYINVIAKDQPHWKEAWNNRINYLRSTLPSVVGIGGILGLGLALFF